MDSYTTLSSRIPDAPILRIKVINPTLSIEKRPRAIIDSGADITAIPKEIIDDLKLEKSGYENIGDVGNKPTYNVKIRFKTFEFEKDVTENSDSFVWLGRDIINELNVLLEGKNKQFEISEP
jgi:hypothetical protein